MPSADLLFYFQVHPFCLLVLVLVLVPKATSACYEMPTLTWLCDAMRCDTTRRTRADAAAGGPDAAEALACEWQALRPD
eukprot:SAG11_NODE_1574_length_4659_cov_4.583333_7_plen_79_part_00